MIVSDEKWLQESIVDLLYACEVDDLWGESRSRLSDPATISALAPNKSRAGVGKVVKLFVLLLAESVNGGEGGVDIVNMVHKIIVTGNCSDVASQLDAGS